MKRIAYIFLLLAISLTSTFVSAQQQPQKQNKSKTLTNDDLITEPIDTPSKDTKEIPTVVNKQDTGIDIKDSAKGIIYCNNEAITIRSSIAIWEVQEKRLSILLFKSQITDDIVKYWTENYRSPIILAEKDYFAKLELKVKPSTEKIYQDNIESYLFYIGCPTAQLNINRSIFTDPKRMIRDFPSFEGSLKTGGQIRFITRESESFKLVNTNTRWELQISTNIFVK
ncbi:MAG: hypothetical protein AB1489_17460 [Acidobacteriota bacterium]